jgi:hypothetical protein
VARAIVVGGTVWGVIAASTTERRVDSPPGGTRIAASLPLTR